MAPTAGPPCINVSIIDVVYALVSSSTVAAVANGPALLSPVVLVLVNDARKTLNITTFAEALNSSLGLNYSKPLPDGIQAVDRCWCDFSAGGFFEPFNITHWEYVSVQRLKDDFERKQKIEEATLETKENNDTHTLFTPTPVGSFNLTMPRTAAPGPSSLAIPLKSASRDLRSIFRLFHYALKGDPSPDLSSSAPASELQSPPPDTTHTPSRLPPQVEDTGPLFRREYDLRPYGLGILVDFGWTR
ncbi:hypothetical protein C0995_009566 [Termitomyces sp. Mi166|nr:hypothetical protein C0995_009566 [Termitomyces sp. Mi166\